MKKIFILFLLTISSYAYAQDMTSYQDIISYQYSIGFGTGDLGSYIGKTSFRGFNVDYRKLVTPNVRVGFDLGWNVFYDERPSEVYTYENISYSGKQYRYNNQFPLLVAADYYFLTDKLINPFIGFGIGTMYSKRETDMGQYKLDQDAWNFAIRPEIGILYRINEDLGFTLTGKYFYGFKAGDLPAQGYFTLNFGLAYTP